MDSNFTDKSTLIRLMVSEKRRFKNDDAPVTTTQSSRAKM